MFKTWLVRGTQEHDLFSVSATLLEGRDVISQSFSLRDALVTCAGGRGDNIGTCRAKFIKYLEV